MKIKKFIEDLIWKYKEYKRFKTAPIYNAIFPDETEIEEDEPTEICQFKCIAPSEVPCFNRYDNRMCSLDIDYNCSMRADIDKYGFICISEEQLKNLMSENE
jgi:hypothetical protein